MEQGDAQYQLFLVWERSDNSEIAASIDSRGTGKRRFVITEADERDGRRAAGGK
jgi:hypothetical protein